jgi:hypothetical protein
LDKLSKLNRRDVGISLYLAVEENDLERYETKYKVNFIIALVISLERR